MGSSSSQIIQGIVKQSISRKGFAGKVAIVIFCATTARCEAEIQNWLHNHQELDVWVHLAVSCYECAIQIMKLRQKIQGWITKRKGKNKETLRQSSRVCIWKHIEVFSGQKISSEDKCALVWCIPTHRLMTSAAALGGEVFLVLVAFDSLFKNFYFLS